MRHVEPIEVSGATSKATRRSLTRPRRKLLKQTTALRATSHLSEPFHPLR